MITGDEMIVFASGPLITYSSGGVFHVYDHELRLLDSWIEPQNEGLEGAKRAAIHWVLDQELKNA